MQENRSGASGGARSGPPVHLPVLLHRVSDLIAPVMTMSPHPVVVDATLGLGGHASALLERFDQLRLIGIDRDPHALELAGERLAGFGPRARFAHAVYDQLPDVLEELEVPVVHGILLDLGVSSMQLDAAERGFAYSQDVTLDMRMDPSRGQTAADVLNTYSASDLARILRTYGEERFASRIADAVVRARSEEPFTTSARLVALLHDVVPKAAQRSGGHPAKRTFQALRMEVNDELGALERALPRAVGELVVGGRLVVLAYHSLEDRLVKQTFARLAQPDVPPGVPEVPPGHEPIVRLLTRGAEQATKTEVEANPRAASVRLRAAERISDRQPPVPPQRTKATRASRTGARR